MELMVDASTLICIILNEPEKEKLISLTKGTELVSPEMISFEIGNALSRMYKRHRLNEEQIINNPAASGRGMLFLKGGCTQGFNTL